MSKCQFLTFSFGRTQRLEGLSYWGNEKSFPTKPMLKRYSQITNMENIACVDVFIKINVSTYELSKIHRLRNEMNYEISFES